MLNTVSTSFKIIYMGKFNLIRPIFFLRSALVAVIALLLLFASGCSRSISPPQTEAVEELRSGPIDPNLLAQIPEAVALPEALVELQTAGTLTAPVPAISSIEILAESGLQVAYTKSTQIATVPALTVELNWIHMQSCLHQVGVAPLVLVRSVSFAPLTSIDDVIHTIDGIPVASSTMGAIPVIQISESDFLMPGEANGYNLRSIMGRLLWSSAGLSARDYPYSCARQLVESE